ncbi:MAG TPA: sensor histidine kinase KdpD [Caulobacteraceae bacterium]|nr:sensor histidine kinase KdpD [Caulobacteraceae bacterium]
MSEDPRRPDPEALLAGTRKPGRGRLKVFLGMAPGVGKTYEMLRSARRRKAEGGEVLVGVVETHGRKETESLLRGLEVLPRQPTEYKGRTLLEFDIDAAIARGPKLLLVDEYAHSNVPGSRHPKRWQDVEEILDAGVDVWTTLNVQHLESLVEVVLKITGVRQRETVPDSALSRADEIELVDITPDALRQRLAEGKIYLPETAGLAAENFFKPENLTALRELALRRMAQTVDDQLVAAMRQRGVEGPWAAGERILVLIAGNGSAAALVRAGRRLSDMMMDAPWTVAHVDRPTRSPDGGAIQARLGEAMKLAEQLGGSAVVLTGDDVVSTVIEYALRNNVTQIVVGKSHPTWWRVLTGRALTPALLSRIAGAALHIITETGPPPSRPRSAARAAPIAWRGHAGALLSVAVATGVAALSEQVNAGANLSMIFMLSVLTSGLAFGLWPAIVAAALAALVYNFLFLSPRLTLWIGHPADVLTFAVFFAVAIGTGLLTGRVRDHASSAGRRASAVTALLAASRRLSIAPTREVAAQVLAEHLAAAISGKAVVFLPEGDEIAPAGASPAMETFSTAELAAARWAWERGEPAGAGTGTLPNLTWTFRPLQGVKARSGVTATEAVDLGADDERFILALLDQGAVALERAEFAVEAADAEAFRRSDRLRSALLNSVSHDLRTPLSTVLGSATTLLDYGKSLSAKVQRDLLESIREEAERLSRYVGDLLDMSRLEGGALAPRREWTDVREVLTSAIGQAARGQADKRIVQDFPATLSMVKTDPSLLEQALVNIIQNAIAYSPAGSMVEAAAFEDRSHVVISIEDRGRGIAPVELQRVFEKFQRLEEASDRGQGAGLGLAISKGFVEAMGGRIGAVSPVHDGHGTRIVVSLPKEMTTAPGLL